MLTRDEVSESSKSRGDCANEESKRGYDTADPEKAKRPRWIAISTAWRAHLPPPGQIEGNTNP
ncbi:unnamed protein product [Brassica napus]|uniref:(rape) hypothetical protein n=1 Tax=Brassica napus TaxID=3708 RepID=A0A816XLE1_BRANA|nr:unnamed protein product [Brassica napus]